MSHDLPSRGRYFRQADPPGPETCLVYLIVALFILGTLTWIVLKTAGVF